MGSRSRPGERAGKVDTLVTTGRARISDEPLPALLRSLGTACAAPWVDSTPSTVSRELSAIVPPVEVTGIGRDRRSNFRRAPPEVFQAVADRPWEVMPRRAHRRPGRFGSRAHHSLIRLRHNSYHCRRLGPNVS